MAEPRGVATLRIEDRGAAVRLSVHVQPRASRDGIAGVHGGALRVRVSAPPVEDAANDAAVALIASALGVKSRAVRIVGGRTSRRKIVEIDGVTRAAVLAVLRASGSG